MTENTAYLANGGPLYRCFEGECYASSAITSSFGNSVVDNWHSKRGIQTHFMCSYTLEGPDKTKTKRMAQVKKNAEGYARKRKTILAQNGSAEATQLGFSCHNDNGIHWIPLIFMVSYIFDSSGLTCLCNLSCCQNESDTV